MGGTEDDSVGWTRNLSMRGTEYWSMKGKKNGSTRGLSCNFFIWRLLIFCWHLFLHLLSILCFPICQKTHNIYNIHIHTCTHTHAERTLDTEHRLMAMSQRSQNSEPTHTHTHTHSCTLKTEQTDGNELTKPKLWINTCTNAHTHTHTHTHTFFLSLSDMHTLKKKRNKSSNEPANPMVEHTHSNTHLGNGTQTDGNVPTKSVLWSNRHTHSLWKWNTDWWQCANKVHITHVHTSHAHTQSVHTPKHMHLG